MLHMHVHKYEEPFVTIGLVNLFFSVLLKGSESYNPVPAIWTNTFVIFDI